MVFTVFVSFGCLGELLGASLSFWEPPEVQKNLLGSNVKGSGISNFCNFLHFSWFGCLGELMGASLSFWEPPEVQKTLLGSNVKGSGISISVIFFIFLGFYCFCFVWVPGKSF